jgi:3-oxoacyl-[acyl-carrier-protein] synthase-3
MILDSFKDKLVPYWASMPTSIEMYGNTSGASIPLTMALSKPQGMTMLCGYGSGLQWGVAAMDLDVDYKEIVEV